MPLSRNCPTCSITIFVSGHWSEAWKEGASEIFNTDQASQLTSRAFTEKLKAHEVRSACAVEEETWIIFLWKGYEEVSNTKIST